MSRRIKRKTIVELRGVNEFSSPKVAQIGHSRYIAGV